MMKSLSIRMLPQLFFLLLFCTAYASPTDVLYVRDGSEVEGTIIEVVTGQTVKIRALDGKIYVYMMKDITKMHIDPSSKVKVINTCASAEDETPPAPAIPHRAWSVSLAGGAAVPVGAFGSTVGTERGLATIGWGGAVDGSLALVPSVDLVATGAIAYNALDFSQIHANGYIVLSDVGSWRSIWALAGLKAYTAIGTATELFGMGEAGTFFGRTFRVDTTPGRNSRGGTFGVGLTAGIRRDFLEFSVRYLRANPEYQSARPVPGTTKYEYFRQPTACLIITGAVVL